MTVHKITLHQFTLGLAACLSLAVQATKVSGQFNALGGTGILAQIGLLQDDEFCGDCCEHDLQFFSPVDFDFECQPLRKDCGWFFGYEKVSWAMTGDRVAVGNPNVQVLSEAVYPGNVGADLGQPPPQYQIINGLQDVPPFADFGWGERYKFGQFYEGNGWSIEVLDGPEVSAGVVFGAGPEQFGFGSVHVNFDAPPGFFLGFRDYQIQTFNGADFVVSQNPVVTGPGGVADDITDDINGNALAGFFFFGIDANADGTLDDDEVTGNGVDFGDLHMFNLTFDQVSVRNTTETVGVELMHTHRLKNGHKMTKNQNNHLHIGYGVRFLRLRDHFAFNGTSPLFGTMQFATEAENQLVGPQIRAQWTSQRGRWMWDFDGRCMFAYNVTDADQTGSYGLDDRGGIFGTVINPGLAPGALNRLLIGQPNTFSYGRRSDEFSPTVEIRANLSYQITSSIAAKLGYTGIFVDNISRGAAITNYSLPDFGFLQAGKQDIYINGANFGFDVVY